MKITSGIGVYVCDGPHCGMDGQVDFVDAPKKRALVEDSHDGRLTWIPFKCLRAADGSQLEGGAKLRRT